MDNIDMDDLRYMIHNYALERCVGVRVICGINIAWKLVHDIDFVSEPLTFGDRLEGIIGKFCGVPVIVSAELDNDRMFLLPDIEKPVKVVQSYDYDERPLFTFNKNKSVTITGTFDGQFDVNNDLFRKLTGVEYIQQEDEPDDVDEDEFLRVFSNYSKVNS